MSDFFVTLKKKEKTHTLDNIGKSCSMQRALNASAETASIHTSLHEIDRLTYYIDRKSEPNLQIVCRSKDHPVG